MRLESAAAAALKKWRLSQTRRSSCWCGRRRSFSFLFHDLLVKRFMSCCGLGVGETYSCLVRRAHITDSRWGGDFFHRWAACSSTRSTGRLGTTATFLLFPKPKKIMPQLRTTSLATSTGRGCSKTCRKSFVWQWQSKSYPDRVRCPPNANEVKELCFVEPQATGTNRCAWSRIKCYPDKECHRPSLRKRTALVESEVLLVSWPAFTDCDRDRRRQRGSAIAVVTGYRLFLTPPGSIFMLAYLNSQWNSVSMDTSLRPSAKGSSKLEKEVMFCLGQFPWSGPLTVDFLSKSLRLQAFLKGLGTKRAYSTAKRFARLNYAGRLVSLSACARWKSLRRLLNEPPQVWIFAISFPICTWGMQSREAEGRNTREPWVYGCVLSFLFWSTDKDASSWFLGAHGGRTYQKSF